MFRKITADASASLSAKATGETALPSIPSNTIVNLHTINPTTRANVFTNGAVVTTWDDISGTGVSAYNATAGLRPSTSDAGGGIYAPEFNGTTHTLPLYTTSAHSTTATLTTAFNTTTCDVFVVFKPSAMGTSADNTSYNTAGSRVLWGDSGGYHGMHLNTNGVAASYFDTASQNFATSATESTATLNNVHVARWSRNPKSQIVKVGNGSVIGKLSSSTGTVGGSTYPVSIGSMGSSRYFQGHVLAVVAYNRILSSADSADLYAVLSSLYGCAVPDGTEFGTQLLANNKFSTWTPDDNGAPTNWSQWAVDSGTDYVVRDAGGGARVVTTGGAQGISTTQTGATANAIYHFEYVITETSGLHKGALLGTSLLSYSTTGTFTGFAVPSSTSIQIDVARGGAVNFVCTSTKLRRMT